MDNPSNELPLEAMSDRNVGIKLIGVGGGGSNAVDRLKMENLDRLQLAVINTDFKALSTSPVQDKIRKLWAKRHKDCMLIRHSFRNHTEERPFHSFCKFIIYDLCYFTCRG